MEMKALFLLNNKFGVIFFDVLDKMLFFILIILI